MRGDAFFFLAFILFFFILWLETGGPTRPISFSGPFITPITNVNQNQSGYGSLGNFHLSNLGTSGQLTDMSQQITDARSFGTPSPYRGKVTIEHNTSALSETDRKREYLTLKAAHQLDSPISISGWQLVSTASSTNVTIPLGTPIVRLGIVNATQPVILNSGDEAVIISGPSPVGASFRENMCTGYFEQYQDFYPSFPDRCPAPIDDLARFYSGNPQADDTCYSYMQSIGSCSVPMGLPDKPTASCRAFIANYLNYNGCVAAHRNDTDFPDSTWHIYLNQDYELWKPSRDSIKLLDQNGKTVDMLTY